MKYLDPGRRHRQATPDLAARAREAAKKAAESARVNRSEEGIERNAWYNTKRWRKLRRAVIDEEQTCRFCGAPAEHVDHIEHGPNWRERFFDRTNLRALCARCHNSRSASDRARMKRQRRA
jgi:5-methylcytosine-specific restriction endonuclease McrA